MVIIITKDFYFISVKMAKYAVLLMRNEVASDIKKACDDRSKYGKI